jgi:RNA polymerase sigma-70 factor (ECF subfamily)
MATDWITTSTLLLKLRDFDDDAAWRRLVERFRRPIAGFAIEMGVSPDDADDVVQETLLDFAKAYRDGHYDRERGQLRRWLFGIAYRRAARQRRRLSRARDEWAPPEAALDVADEQAAAAAWDRRWEAEAIEECVRQARREFAPEVFAAFELVVGKERTPAEAAAELGVAVKSVYNAKHRVLRRIRELSAAFDATEEPGGALPRA